MASKNKEILLGVTGSIAAYKACDILRRLRDRDLGVTVIMTKEAAQLVTPLTFASLSGRKVYIEMFDQDTTSWEIDHVALAEKAEVLLIAPATANVIGKLANGIADDLLTCTAMATKAKILIAPAMNTGMYENIIVQENITKLKKLGIGFIDPVKGKLACGTTGAGHLADVETIVKTVEQALKK
ncbi:MAG TPA: flavoprotein [Candidatus Omnitrophota bacterium]|nr:flavoprotein [Candidatus Omnitrophota bacterium]HPD84581.1 flavoprotein [Candidatus Omnitrophota bacterium]HRZ03439.1 flavoprotein [Candidatus Omnitrophota bacterium]